MIVSVETKDLPNCLHQRAPLSVHLFEDDKQDGFLRPGQLEPVLIKRSLNFPLFDQHVPQEKTNRIKALP